MGVAAISLVLGGCLSTPEPPTGRQGELLHFAFDRDALLRDRVRGHDAACIGGCPVAVPGRIGDGAVALDGTQCLEIADGEELRPSTFTFAAWASVMTPAASFANVFSRPFMGATTTMNTFESFVLPTNAWGVNVGTGIRSTPVVPQVWHHVAGTFDGSMLTMYLDGAPIQESVVGSLRYGTESFLIGCDRDSGVAIFFVTGAIDDVRLYSRPLDAEEIAALFAL